MVTEIKYVEVDDCELALKKDGLGYRIVHPSKNRNGTINWMNLLFGGKRMLLWLIIVFIILGSFYMGVKDIIYSCKDLAENPCDYFRELKCEGDYIKPNIYTQHLTLQGEDILE